MNVRDKLSFISTLHRAPYPAIDPRKPHSSAAGKTVFITGGASGIGFATARNFAIAGASTIVLLSRREETLQKAASELSAAFKDTQFLTHAASITDEAEIQKVFTSVRQNALNKDVDVLVMCAAFVKADKPLSKTPLSEVKTTFETNVFGNLNVVNAFLDTSKEEGKVIVDFTSYASYMPFPQTGPYAASKAAFSFLMRHTQNEHPELRVYTLHPGAVWTDAAAAAGMTKDMLDWDEEDLPGHTAKNPISSLYRGVTFPIHSYENHTSASPSIHRILRATGQEADLLKGKFLASHWDVAELTAKKDMFELDTDLSTIGLRR